MKNFRNESGAFDMPSIIIGVIVVGILTAGVLATIFGVVPWAQDKAAQQALTSVVLAQRATQALTSNDGRGVFKNKAELIADGEIGAGEDFNTAAGKEGTCFTATTRSASGKVFWADSEDAQPKEYASGAKSSCIKLNGLAWDVGTEMKSTWNITAGQELTLPLGGTVNATINWGDGMVDTVTTASPSHTFISANPAQTITIEGTFSSWGGWDWGWGWGWGDAGSLLSVDEWGETGTTDLAGAFFNADSLKHVGSIPATTKKLVYAFGDIDSVFTVGALDTSNVTDMSYMFSGTSSFNKPVNFDTSNVTDMRYMFYGASSFNQPLSFDTSNVTDMFAMFYGASSFSQPLSFDTSSVKSMCYMFYAATAFNQPLNFDTRNVTDMDSMFWGATAFNQPLDFDTRNVTDMFAMFWGATAFNQPLNFETSNVKNMSFMFFEAGAFNQDLSKWNVAEVPSWDSFDDSTPEWVAEFKPQFK